MSTVKMLAIVFLVLALQMTSSVASANEYQVICYWQPWSSQFPQPLTYGVSDIPVHKCTHLVYVFAILDRNTSTIQIGDEHLDIELETYQKFVGLKNLNPNLKTLIAVG